MKKLLTAIAIVVLLMITFSSIAMSSLEDSALATVTAQSGVSVNFDTNILLEVDRVACGDKDGLGAGSIASGAGWVGMTGMKADVRVRIYYLESKQ